MEYINGETISILIFFVGVYGLIARRNIVKSIISIGIMGSAIILFFLTINHTPESVPPIISNDSLPMADPLPQALMITAIIIGVSVTAVALAMFIYVYHKYGTTNWKKAARKRMENDIR